MCHSHDQSGPWNLQENTSQSIVEERILWFVCFGTLSDKSEYEDKAANSEISRLSLFKLNAEFRYAKTFLLLLQEFIFTNFNIYFSIFYDKHKSTKYFP